MCVRLKNDIDVLRPSQKRQFRMLKRSRYLWYALLHQAESTNRFPSACAQLGNVLCQTPSIPRQVEIKDVTETGVVALYGSAAWSLDSLDCDPVTTPETSERKVVIASKSCPECVVQVSGLHWTGFESSERTTTSQSNYISVLTLGWAYIMSTCLIERRKMSTQDKVIYTLHKAPIAPSQGTDLEQDTFDINIGKACRKECRWWQAILATGRGWQAELHRSEQIFYPLWSYQLVCRRQLRISVDLIDHGPEPVATSSEAQQYLYTFARSHGVCDQLLVAFSAVLTMPSHIRYGAPITLPEPVVSEQDVSSASYLDYVPRAEHLPHFMAISLIPGTISSTLFGAIWEPSVQCNLASAWLYPILRETIRPLLESNRIDVVVRIMSIRRPSSAALWLGSAVTGLLPRIFDLLVGYMPSVSLEATVWTRSSQSFMDPVYFDKLRTSRGLLGEKYIRRADECRMLLVAKMQEDGYASPPLCPWTPFGLVRLENTNLYIRCHLTCGHQLRYKSWNWRDRSNQLLSDPGLTIPSVAFGASTNRSLSAQLQAFVQSRKKARHLQLQFSHYTEDLSRAATRNIFSWIVEDGLKPDERILWDHEWLADYLPEDDDSSLEEYESI